MDKQLTNELIELAGETCDFSNDIAVAIINAYATIIAAHKLANKD